MPDDPSARDSLVANLQAAVDKKLTLHEAVLMSLAGAKGEGLVITDRRLILVREQMPLMAGESQVDCFDYPYEMVHTVRVEGAVGGGHLKLVLLTPPIDDKEVTLYFPLYDLSKFDAAAARIRLLVEQTRSVPMADVPTHNVGSGRSQCNSCGAEVRDNWIFCGQCGTLAASTCALCLGPLPPGVRYCPQCGAAAQTPAEVSCRDCGSVIAPHLRYCPHCGTPHGHLCRRCHSRIMEDWAWCAACGVHLGERDGHEEDRAAPVDAATGPARSVTAAEHNDDGMRQYNQEQFESAIRLFRTAVSMEPDNPLFHCNLGVALAEIGADEEARTEYETAIRLAPEDPTPFLNLGYFCAERGDLPAAIELWERAVHLAPDSVEAQEARKNIDQAHET